MRLKEYISAVTEIICKNKADAEVGDALAEGCGTRKAPVTADFERVSAAVQQAIADNKNLLGEFNCKSPLETALDPANVRKHVLAVRYSLRPPEEVVRSAQHKEIADHDDPAFIMSRILNELTSALKVQDLGPVFGIAEKQQFEKEFGRSASRKSEPPASHPHANGDGSVNGEPLPGTPEFEKKMETLMARLRREGKIL